ncbi:hypothetical protein IWX92DRAFT_222664 [Phyllosticta citricarpa]
MTRYRLFGRGTGQGEGNLSWIRNNLSSAIQLLSMAQPAPFFFFFSSYLALPYLCLPRLLLHPSPPTHPHRIILLPWFRNLVAPRFHHSAVRAVADLTTPDDFSAQPGKALHAHSRELSTPSLPLQLIMSVASYPAALGVDGWQSPKTCNGCGALPVPGDESLECQNCTRANFYTERAKPPSPPPSVADSACSLCSKHLAQCDGDKPRCSHGCDYEADSVDLRKGDRDDQHAQLPPTLEPHRDFIQGVRRIYNLLVAMRNSTENNLKKTSPPG